MPRPGPRTGSIHYAPLNSRYKGKNVTLERLDRMFRDNLRSVNDEVYTFSGAVQSVSVTVPIGTIATTGTESVHIPVTRAGRLVSAIFIGTTTLTADDTNYVTFSLTNELGAAGTTAMLAATAANTTQATGGSTFTAKTQRALTVNGTAANLRVAVGDSLLFSVAATGTLANTITNASVTLVFSVIDSSLTPRITRTAGSPLVAPVANTKTVIAQLSASSEANVAGFDWGDHLVIPATAAPIFSCRVQVSAVSSVSRFVFGLASAYNATFNSVTTNAWFRIEGNSLVLNFETDDNTTDSALTSSGITLTAATDYRLIVDMHDLGNVGFYVGKETSGGLGLRRVGQLPMTAAAASDLLQPVCYAQKDSGAGTGSFTVSDLRVLWEV